MPPKKTKQAALARAALARSSRHSSSSLNNTRPSTPSQLSKHSPHLTPAISPTPPDTPAAVSEDEDQANEEISEGVFEHLTDTDAPDVELLEEEEGYHTDDDLSELEDDELQESLRKQKEGESDAVRDMNQETRNTFHILLRDLTSEDWKTAHSNCNLGYGNKSSDRTRRRHAQQAREKEARDAETRKSSVDLSST